MFCKNCGSEIRENDSFCPNCGSKNEYWNVSETAPNTVRREGPTEFEEPNTTLWLILGILSCLFCCLAGGIGTTVYAAKASENVKSRDYETANENIATAKKWFIATIIVGIITFFIGAFAGIH